MVYVLKGGKCLNTMNIVEGNIPSEKFSMLQIGIDNIFSD
ncbi:hypothetical protein HMPREF1154_0308 [Capnocytophaga sp. CM59]|nr:hypothetical protein HMPREF1154_0308 [Capnocytophaga sp. CM59]